MSKHCFVPVNSAQDMSADEKSDDGAVNLSDTITMFSKQCLCKSAHVYYGLRKSKVYGNQRIAVKFLPYDKLYVREAKILHGLGFHPNVVTLLHSDLYNDGPFPAMYIAMELCQKLNLHDSIIKKKKDKVAFDLKEAMLYSKQLVNGLHFIHEKNIINRDLKPHNVLISLDGKDVKIADFGLSKPIKNGRSVTNQSRKGAGTDGYRAPETYNSDVISQFSDIYSLALVIYYIWSYGHHPFGDDHDEWNKNIKRNLDRDLSKILIPDVKEAQGLLDRMLQFEARKRPNTKQVLSHRMFSESHMNTIMSSDANDATLITEEIAGVSLQAEDKQIDKMGSSSTEAQLYGPPSSKLNDTKVKKIHPTKIQAEGTSEKGSLQGNGGYAQPITPQQDSKYTNTSTVGYGSKPTKQKDVADLEALLEEEECQVLIGEGKCLQALVKLNKIVEHGRNELSTQLMIAECNLQLGRNEYANMTISHITEMIMADGPRMVRQIQAVSDEYIKKSCHIPVIILLPILSKLYRFNTSPTHAIDSIERCTNKMDDAIKGLSKEGGRLLIVIDKFAMPAMHEMLEDLRAIDGPDANGKAIEEARALNNIGSSYENISQYKQSMEFHLEGVRILEERFGQRVVEYRLYGSLLNNAATAYHYMGDYAEAESLYVQCIDAEQQAWDFANEDARQDSIERTRGNLQRTRNRMRMM